MINWLKKCFPNLGAPKAEVVLELPPWTVADANQLAAFLDSSTGKKMMNRMRHTATAMCLDPIHYDEQMSSDRRALALVINGIVQLTDEDFWKYRDKEYLESAFIATEFDPSAVDGDEEDYLAE